jgi:hypothetical protein
VDLIRAYDAGHDFPLMAKPMHPTEMLGQVAKSLKHARVPSGVDGEGLLAISA